MEHGLKAAVAVALLGGTVIAAWAMEGRSPWAGASLTPCEHTVTTAKEAVEGSPLGRMAGLRVLHVGAPVFLDGAEEWLPRDSYGCRADVITSAGGRDAMIWRVDPVPEMGQGQVLVRAVIGEGMARMLRDRR